MAHHRNADKTHRRGRRSTSLADDDHDHPDNIDDADDADDVDTEDLDSNQDQDHSGNLPNPGTRPFTTFSNNPYLLREKQTNKHPFCS